MENLIVKQIDLAEILGLTDRRIRQLVGEGVISKSGNGYDLYVCVQEYIDYKNSAAPHTPTAPEVAMLEEKALHEKAKREIAELKLDHNSQNVCTIYTKTKRKFCLFWQLTFTFCRNIIVARNIHKRNFKITIDKSTHTRAAA